MGVTPGKSEKATVQAMFGPPSREVAKKEEGYETIMVKGHAPRSAGTSS